ncbi:MULTISPECIES: hypothetical protein [unclassified Sphingobacterium]|uniref:hypothetical protein n=1 Tax=unclassified Sphingobacterium TaxID=2609468 RepID=UPI0020C2ED84|nr:MULTISPECIES: hypothetical protein [unclassified Sphingobacterium]MBV2225549.1 hypothetical protein [Sphingobacterium mizutaii]
MENYILSFRAPLNALLQRQQIFEKLAREYPQLGPISIDMDDKQYVMNVNAPGRLENDIQNTLLSYGFRVAFLKADLVKVLDPKVKIA